MKMKYKAWDQASQVMIPNESQSYEGQVFQWLHEGQPLQVLQFTGLKDINGVAIYVGDIVKWDDCSNGRHWRVAVVNMEQQVTFTCFDCPTIKNSSAHGHVFNYGNFAYQDTENHLEVIGNVYENPELRGKEDDVG